MIEIQIDDPYLPFVMPARLEAAAQAALAHQHAPSEAELTLVITGDETLHRLNLQFLDIDAPTDVLSFPSGELDPGVASPYLGDILISYPQAAAQAQKGGHTPEAELALLAVHGVLHLLGHDHAEPAEKAAMWAAQSEILANLGLDLIPPE